MSRVRAGMAMAGRISEAEELWYDLARRATFVDGFKAVHRVDPSWPASGTLMWDSQPEGVGRTIERVTSYEARVGQEFDVEDSQITGHGRVAFAPVGDEQLGVELELAYTLKDRKLIVVDLFFIRRAQRDALRRTLQRFAIELRAGRELG